MNENNAIRPYARVPSTIIYNMNVSVSLSVSLSPPVKGVCTRVPVAPVPRGARERDTRERRERRAPPPGRAPAAPPPARRGTQITVRSIYSYIRAFDMRLNSNLHKELRAYIKTKAHKNAAGINIYSTNYQMHRSGFGSESLRGLPVIRCCPSRCTLRGPLRGPLGLPDVVLGLVALLLPWGVVLPSLPDSVP